MSVNLHASTDAINCCWIFCACYFNLQLYFQQNNWSILCQTFKPQSKWLKYRWNEFIMSILIFMRNIHSFQGACQCFKVERVPSIYFNNSLSNCTQNITCSVGNIWHQIFRCNNKICSQVICNIKFLHVFIFNLYGGTVQRLVMPTQIIGVWSLSWVLFMWSLHGILVSVCFPLGNLTL